MITKFLLQLRILPRWVIIVIDILIVALSTFLGYLLRFNFDFSFVKSYPPENGIFVTTVSCFVSLILTKSYAGIVRYTGLKDGLRVFYTLILGHLLAAGFNYTSVIFNDRNLIPYSVILISFLASFLFSFQYRLLIKNIFSHYGKVLGHKTETVIFGAGQMGLVTKHLLDDNNRSGYRVVAFLEDDKAKIGKEINGTGIFSFNKLIDIKDKFGVKELVIAVNNLSVERKNEIVDLCLKLYIKVSTVPELNSWVKGELSIQQIKEIRIEDLLERDSIILNKNFVFDQIEGKTICITGAAGSIGSELVNQVLKFNPAKLVLIDQAESPLYELSRQYGFNKTEIILALADVTDENRLDVIFDENKLDIIYHAAAYKHVPLMEESPYEAINCNVLGTKNVADLSVKYGVKKFVMVSTDKAVNPTNVMGASKRIAEMYVQSLDILHQNTAFITTRFGNVLGSNGSVIPYFKNQIQSGGPITVTHPEITRYFMTISEACELILEAGSMGNGGEIFLFDMGKSIKIVDLAEKMIRLSGFKPYKDIDIVFTGLRQGEKLYEELLADKENSLPTYHSKILVAKVSVPNHSDVKISIDKLKSQIESSATDIDLVTTMKKLVPEYKSNSSVYELLD